jgi:hypothetical protein
MAQCRANSKLGGGLDGLNGLGYNVNNNPGVCPSFPLGGGQGVGAPILSGYPGSTGKANNVAFNITGTDPFTNAKIAAATTVSVGASPLVFVAEVDHGLAGLSAVEDDQLQAVFSGTNCNASAFGLPAAPISAFLREPLSGTMNTAEYTTFRFPDQSGLSQETGVNAVNPLGGAPCAGGGGIRSRAIGTGEEVKSVQNAFVNTGLDGIGYTFFSYGNVGPIANSVTYRYVRKYGADPIWQIWGTTYDPGQPAIPGALPSAANLPAACGGAFPCPESKIWTGHLSFPMVRSGAYTEWSLLRIVSSGTPLAAAKLLVTGAQTYNVNVVPDFIPALKVGTADPGLQLIRSHYGPGTLVNNGATEKGKDVGGCIIPLGSVATRVVMSNYEVTHIQCVLYPF